MRSALFFFHLIACISTFAQDINNDFIVDFIDTRKGLPHNYVTSVTSDDENFKWIGTENGVIKYTGYDFDYIKPSEKYSGLLNENIETLFKDNEGNIWIGTKSGGVSYFNLKKNTIKNFNNLLHTNSGKFQRVTAICQDSKGYIWIGTWDEGIFVIDHHNKKLIRKFDFSSSIYAISRDKNNNIWFCMNRQLVKYDPSEDRLISYKAPAYITDVVTDEHRDKIWFSAGRSTKLYNFNFEKQTLDSIETGIKTNFSKNIALDNEDRLWIGTWGRGVYRSNKDLTKFTQINLVADHPEKNPANYKTILDIHIDKNNIVWLATADGGLLKLTEGNGFKNASSLIKNNRNLNILSISRNEKEIFMSTMSKGLYSGQNFSDLKKVKAFNNILVKTFKEYKNKLYVGTETGLYLMDLSTKNVHCINENIRKITDLFIDSQDILYIGTQQMGLVMVPLDSINNQQAYRFYSEQLSGDFYIASNRIRGLQEDKNGNIWMGTYNGLHVLPKSSKKFIHHSKILKGELPNIINSIEIHGDYSWVSTPQGLYKLKYDNNELLIEDKIDKKNGLNNDFICSATFDDSGNMWISTATEIVKYNPKENLLINYGENNNIQVSTFNKNVYFNYKNEWLYFGGVDNITFFNPKNIVDFNVVPDVEFTKLKVNNNLVEYQQGSEILDQSFSYANQITLTHHDKYFSVSYASTNFLAPSSVKFRYMLEGYQKNWINVGSQNEINFAGLQPGNYKLKIQASRDNKNWSASKVLSINLLNSPFLGFWAILCYVLIGSGIVMYFVKARHSKIKLKNNLTIARIEKEKEMELSEAKLNFFTNISHEFRTPLTLILTPLTELLSDKSLPKKAHNNLTLIERNSTRLLNLINQLLDFRKADNSFLKLNVSYGNFVRFSQEVFFYFQHQAKSKNISYEFVYEKEEIFFPFDRNKMEIVLCNMLSNAIKYCDAGDEIVLGLAVEGDYCTISVKDTGIGMSEKNLEKIFDRFFQIKSANTARMIGSGIGLAFSKKIIELHHGSISVNSEKNVGTEFIIKLSTDANLYEGEINDKFIGTDNIKAYDTDFLLQKEANLSLESQEHTVLIIDDNLEILSYLKYVLEDTYNVIEADNGTTGLEIAAKELPDLIVSDVMMPGIDGITLCKELKSQISTSHIPIILLTARTSTVYEIQGLQTGADDYITKPFNANVLKSRILSLLQNREKSRDHFLNKVRFEPTVKNPDEEENDSENAFISKAILIIESNLQNPDFGIDIMVDELNMSQSTLYRKIKSLTGLSISAFIRAVRLKKAAQLIMTNQDLNLNQIAYEVGFNDYKHFNTWFKKQFNCLPSKYKEKKTKSLS